MNLLSVIIGLLFINFTVLNSQNSPTELWRTAEYIEYISFRGPSITLDKHQNVYMLTNQADVNPFGGFTLVKYDSLGHLLWNNNYPPWIIGNFYGSFTVDSLGTAYVGVNFNGALPDYEADATLVKYGPEGGKRWEANYSLDQVGDEYLLYSDLDPLGHLIVVGSNNGTDTVYTNILLVTAIDTATGQELWQKRLSNLLPTNLRIHDNQIELLAIEYVPDYSYSNYVIVQMDFNGTVLEQHVEPYPQYGSLEWSHISKNGDVLLGNSYAGYEITRVTAMGDTLWHYLYPDPSGNMNKQWIRHLTEDDSAFVYATGLIRLPGLFSEMMTTKLSPAGEVVWQKIYHSANDSLGDEGYYLAFNDQIVAAAGGTQLANHDVVGVINVYRNLDGEELYNILLGYENIFVIDQVQLVNNKIYYSGEGFNGSLDEIKIITGCIQLPQIVSYTQEQNPDLQVKAFPNPTVDNISLSNLDLSAFTSLEVLNLEGKVLTTKKIEQETMQVDLSVYPAGTYIISLKGKNIVINKKVIKM